MFLSKMMPGTHSRPETSISKANIAPVTGKGEEDAW